MNVFEDLIVELKEENLLEDTVIGAGDAKKNNSGSSKDERPEFPAPGDVNFEMKDEIVGAEAAIEIVGIADEGSLLAEMPITDTKKPKAGKKYFNKRAVDEMASLQMVEHILTGVEREYMKVVPKNFDDFNAKKALNALLNISENSNSEEHKAAEFAFMRETEAWGLALTERDRSIGVANIRRYCENSRPALSSQAMLALARFYRNSPYSESVRSKFDFVITRLFSRAVEQDKRVCLFDRNQMLNHINTLYNEWSSVPLYDADSDESNVMLTGLSFDDLAIEAESAVNFDQLIESDFFSRVRLFKESISELFYAPTVIISAIESNIRIGNAYVKLIVRERRKMDAASIQMKYGDFDGQSVSDAAGRSLDLVELLSILTDEVLDEAEKEEELPVETEDRKEKVTLNFDSKAETKPNAKKERSPFVENLIQSAQGINRWILGMGFVLILISGVLYIWSLNIVDETAPTAGVAKVEMDGTVLAEHIKTGKISGDTFYGLLGPTWDGLTKEKRQEYLQKVFEFGAEKGYTRVNLIGKDGKTAGYASAKRIEAIMP